MGADIIFLTDAEERIVSLIIRIIENNIDALRIKIEKELSSRVDNEKLNGKRLNEFIKQELEKFLKFLKAKDKNVAVSGGEQLASEGVDMTILIDMLSISDLFVLKGFTNKDDKETRIFFKIKELYIRPYISAYAREKYNPNQQYDEINSSVDNKILEINKHNTDFFNTFAQAVKPPLERLEKLISAAKEEIPGKEHLTLTSIEEDIYELKKKVTDILDNEKILLNKGLYDHNPIAASRRNQTVGANWIRNII